jgi:hypothetical protein
MRNIIISQDVQLHILLFLPINVIYSKVTLLDKEWHNTTQELITWRTMAQREWTSMNEFLTRAMAASKQQHNEENVAVDKYNENLNESGKRGRDYNSKSNAQRKESKNITVERTIYNLNSVKFWKDLVIGRFTRDNLYLYDLIAATRSMLHNVQLGEQQHKYNISTINSISNKIKLLDQIYKCDDHISKNKYLKFMWDSILYKTIIKEKDDSDYRTINHTHHVEANFIDHLFNIHYVKMSYDVMIYTGSYERVNRDECTVVFTNKEDDDDYYMEEPNNDADEEEEDEEEEEEDEKIEFTLSNHDKQVLAQNETMLEALYDSIGIQKDDPDKPTLVQFASFLRQFCFMNDVLQHHLFFVPT